MKPFADKNLSSNVCKFGGNEDIIFCSIDFNSSFLKK